MNESGLNLRYFLIADMVWFGPCYHADHYVTSRKTWLKSKLVGGECSWPWELEWELRIALDIVGC